MFIGINIFVFQLYTSTYLEFNKFYLLFDYYIMLKNYVLFYKSTIPIVLHYT